mgnify:CR=1 FL=1
MKYPDDWETKVKNAPVKFFEEKHANAWTDQKLKAKVNSWAKSEKGYTCTQSPLSDFCKKGICVKKKFGILAGSKGSYPVLANLRKICKVLEDVTRWRKELKCLIRSHVS